LMRPPKTVRRRIRPLGVGKTSTFESSFFDQHRPGVVMADRQDGVDDRGRREACE
jgi:hypothetical protein